jgi:hypothetical protein
MWRAGCRQGCTCPSWPRRAQAIARAYTQLSAKAAALRPRIHGESGATAVFWSVRSYNRYLGCSVKVILSISWRTVGSIKRPSHPWIGCLDVATNSRPSRQKKRSYKAPLLRYVRRGNAHRTRVFSRCSSALKVRHRIALTGKRRLPSRKARRPPARPRGLAPHSGGPRTRVLKVRAPSRCPHNYGPASTFSPSPPEAVSQFAFTVRRGASASRASPRLSGKPGLPVPTCSRAQ